MEYKIRDYVVSSEIIARLREFKAEHGRNWKAALRALWISGCDEGLLRQARNVIGPNDLDRVKL